MAKKKSFFELLTGKPGEEKQEEVQVKKKDLSEEGEIKKQVVESKGEEELKAEEEGQLTIDVFQTDKEIVIKSPVAGVRPEDLDVSISNDMITIKGRRENDEAISEDDYFFQELYWGPFSRSVILPTEVEVEKIKASLKDGLLTIRLPKVKRETVKKIEIKLE